MRIYPVGVAYGCWVCVKALNMENRITRDVSKFSMDCNIRKKIPIGKKWERCYYCSRIFVEKKKEKQYAVPVEARGKEAVQDFNVQ